MYELKWYRNTWYWLSTKHGCLIYQSSSMWDCETRQSKHCPLRFPTTNGESPNKFRMWKTCRISRIPPAPVVKINWLGSAHPLTKPRNSLANFATGRVSGWWFERHPSEKWWSSSSGMMRFPIYGKIKFMATKPPTRAQDWIPNENVASICLHIDSGSSK